MTEVKAYIFDVFGTLVDWRTSIAREANDFFSAKSVDVNGLVFADYWRGRYQPAMERIRSGNRGYVRLDDLHHENLLETLDHFELRHPVSDEESLLFAKAWEKLDPWADVVEGLTHLKKHAIIAPCSNGSIALMTQLARYGSLPWDCILGADIAQNYKPHPSVYAACCSALRLEPSEVMMVAAHNDDLEAAQNAGLKTCFIPRVTEYGEHQTKDLAATGNWNRIVTTIAEVAS